MLYPLRIGCLTALFASTALALGSAELANSCSFDIYYQMGDSTSESGVIYTLPANGGFYSDTFDTNSSSNFQLSLDPNVIGSGQVLSFEYSVDVGGGAVYYDLSVIDSNGDPFAGNNVELSTTNPDCPTISIAEAYRSPGGIDTERCGDQYNLILTFCGS